jgi:hypothetical protein
MYMHTTGCLNTLLLSKFLYSIHYPSSSIMLIGLCKLPWFLGVDNMPVSFQFPAGAKHRSQYIDS